jgi:V-type H+-transporting ATPase subunit E
MHKLQEPTVVLTCREEDLPIVSGQVEPAKQLYAQKYKTPSPTITLNRKTFLAPGPNAFMESASW